jgi:multidrug efflux system membrane fusion protein
MRLVIAFSALTVLGVGIALYAGALPLDVTALWRYVAATTAAPPPPLRTPPAPVPVVVAPVRAEDVPITLTGIGTVQATNTVNVKTQIDGQITQILFTEGQDVQQGTPLAVIDPRPLAAMLAQQQATKIKDQALLTGAVLDLQRYENLVLKDFASRQQVDEQRALVDQYKAQINTDQAQIDYAQTQLGFTTIRAPIAGRVGIRQVDQGNFVHSADNTTIVVITQLQPIAVVFTLPAADVARSHLTLGQVHIPVIAVAADDTTELDRGTVDLVDNTVDQTTGTIKLKASFPNAGLHLWPGDFVNGRLITDTRHNGLTVPAAAVRHGPRGDFVWLVNPDQTVNSHRVVVEQTTGDRVLVTGVKRGDEVVTEGWFRLDEKSRITIAGK